MANIDHSKNSIQSPFLDVVQAANYLRIRRSTLDRYRTSGTGPHYRKHGGKVAYHLNDLDIWSGKRCYRSTGERAK